MHPPFPGTPGSERPWEALHELVVTGDPVTCLAFLESIGAAETARAISRLPAESRLRLLALLDAHDAAVILEEIPEVEAADLMEEMPPERAAQIMEELRSDRIADVLGELSPGDAEAILERMEPDDAAEARAFLAYPPDTAGGLMISEYLAFPAKRKVRAVLADLSVNRERYRGYHVQYFYVVDKGRRLVGVLRVHDLLFPRPDEPLSEVMITDPLRVPVEASVDELRDFFEAHPLLGAPVVDADGCLVGVVLPEAVEDARRKRAVKTFLGFSGIVGGEEFRTMPLLNRSGRRLSWLSLNIVLNVIAASVIAVYQDTLAAAITLAVFLPMVSDMSGCSGNQAVAVSLRELALGLVRPQELGRVLIKEASLGIINGLALGTLLAGVAMLWKGNPYLGLVVGGALAANTVVAVSLGGLLPLLLKRVNADPALVSGPLLTTVTDMCGFFFVLSFATAVLPRLA